MKLSISLRSFASFVVLCSIISPLHASSKALQQKSKRQVLTGRIVAHVPLLAVATVGLNHESFIVELDSKKGNSGIELVKLSYRYYIQDLTIPPTFLDYSLRHSFTAIRDESCDESWGSLSTRYISDQGTIVDRQSALAYSKNAPVPAQEPQAILPCYVMRPSDYRSHKSAPIVSNAGNEHNGK